MNKGFTLVELAIVIVIIGLLVGGILVGQELVNQARLTNVIKDLQSYKTSYEVFKSKYNAIPGDMRNASTFWGLASGGCPYGTRVGKETCNGNGDQQIGGGSNEMYLFWQHLSNAGLLKGSYTGFAADQANVTGSNEPGTNTPGLTYGGTSGVGIRYLDMSGTSTGHWKINFGNYLSIGKQNSTAVYETTLFSTQDAFSIDTKIDDGKPGNGRMYGSWIGTCSDSYVNDDFNANYRISSSSAPACHMQFKLDN